MKDELIRRLKEDLSFNNESAERVATTIKNWVDDENRKVTCPVHLPEQVAVASIDDENILSIAISKSTNIADMAIIQSGTDATFIKLRLDDYTE